MASSGSLPAGTPEVTGRETVASRVYADLRRRIIALELPPDTHLLRSELAAEYGVSQTPLREAVQRLESDGLVEVHPQSKTVVTRINVAQIYEAHFIRTGLETEAVRQLTRMRNTEVLAKAREIIGQQKAIARDTSQLARFQELDDAFHRTLFIGIGQEGAHALLKSRSGHLSRMRKMQAHDDQKIRFILDGHTEIVDAIASGNEDEAIVAMRVHLSRTVVNAPTLRERHRNFFC